MGSEYSVIEGERSVQDEVPMSENSQLSPQQSRLTTTARQEGTINVARQFSPKMAYHLTGSRRPSAEPILRIPYNALHRYQQLHTTANSRTFSHSPNKKNHSTVQYVTPAPNARLLTANNATILRSPKTSNTVMNSPPPQRTSTVSNYRLHSFQLYGSANYNISNQQQFSPSAVTVKGGVHLPIVRQMAQRLALTHSPRSAIAYRNSELVKNESHFMSDTKYRLDYDSTIIKPFSYKSPERHVGDYYYQYYKYYNSPYHASIGSPLSVQKTRHNSGLAYLGRQMSQYILENKPLGGYYKRMILKFEGFDDMDETIVHELKSLLVPKLLEINLNINSHRLSRESDGMLVELNVQSYQTPSPEVQYTKMTNTMQYSYDTCSTQAPTPKVVYNTPTNSFPTTVNNWNVYYQYQYQYQTRSENAYKLYYNLDLNSRRASENQYRWQQYYQQYNESYMNSAVHQYSFSFIRKEQNSFALDEESFHLTSQRTYYAIETMENLLLNLKKISKVGESLSEELNYTLPNFSQRQQGTETEDYRRSSKIEELKNLWETVESHPQSYYETSRRAMVKDSSRVEEQPIAEQQQQSFASIAGTYRAVSKITEAVQQQPPNSNRKNTKNITIATENGNQEYDNTNILRDVSESAETQQKTLFYDHSLQQLQDLEQKVISELEKLENEEGESQEQKYLAKSSYPQQRAEELFLGNYLDAIMDENSIEGNWAHLGTSQENLFTQRSAASEYNVIKAFVRDFNIEERVNEEESSKDYGENQQLTAEVDIFTTDKGSYTIPHKEMPYDQYNEPKLYYISPERPLLEICEASYSNSLEKCRYLYSKIILTLSDSKLTLSDKNLKNYEVEYHKFASDTYSQQYKEMVDENSSENRITQLLKNIYRLNENYTSLQKKFAYSPPETTPFEYFTLYK